MKKLKAILKGKVPFFFSKKLKPLREKYQNKSVDRNYTLGE